MTIDTSNTAGAEQREMQERETDAAFVERLDEDDDAWYDEHGLLSDRFEKIAEKCAAAIGSPGALGIFYGAMESAAAITYGYHIARLGATRASEPQGEDVDRAWAAYCQQHEIVRGNTPEYDRCKRFFCAGFAAMPRPEPQPADPIGVVPTADITAISADAYYVRISFEPKGMPVRRFRISRGLAENLVAELRSLIAPPFQPDPQGEARPLCEDCGCQHLDDNSCPSPETQMDRCRAVAAAEARGLRLAVDIGNAMSRELHECAVEAAANGAENLRALRSDQHSGVSELVVRLRAAADALAPETDEGLA